MRRTQLLEVRGWTAYCLAMLLVCALAGCGGGGGGSTSPPADTTAPVVAVSSWSRNLTATGGNVTIQAAASDSGSGVARVEARIATPSGSVVTLAMPTSLSGGYGGTYAAPANSGTTKQTYTFTVYAVDNAGNSSSDGAYTFDVPASENPPPPPPFQID